ncbi:MAG: tRNA pseudouridine(38-40) synthase TruA [Ignavibacteriota bacterium]|nr:tRNA pseudouridine(38-40) synthase TruA [Ignavibacteriota bacterium]
MSKYNYKLTIEYDGSDYCGWQRQKRFRNSIQEVIETGLEKLLKEEIKITGAGRTDAGVHAYNQTANFKTDIKIENVDKFLYSVNSIIPKSITIKSIKKVKDDFHSRYSAKKREYIYRIVTKDISIGRKYYHKLNYKLDFKIIDEFIKILKGYKSYRSLCKNTEDKHNFCCEMKSITYRQNKKEGTIEFKLVADRYLHSMVRALTGTLIDLGRNRIGIKDTITKFNRGEKIKATYLPANALFLNKIYY